MAGKVKERRVREEFRNSEIPRKRYGAGCANLPISLTLIL